MEGIFSLFLWIGLFFFFLVAGSLLLFALHHRQLRSEGVSSDKLVLRATWMFIAVEILLFGGFIIAYAVYRAHNPEIFAHMDQHLNVTLGGIGTLLLIVSSFTMARALRAVRPGERSKTVVLLFITLLCAFGFIGGKFIEYKASWEQSLLGINNPTPPAQVGESTVTHEFPRADLTGREVSTIAPAAAAPGGLATVSEAASSPAAETPMSDASTASAGDTPLTIYLFFWIFLAMVGLHGLHVLVGMIMISWLLVRTERGDFGPEYTLPVDLVGRYWQLTAMAWIVLFPLLYLIH